MMKYVQKFAAGTLLFISVLMCMALSRYQTDEEMSLLPEQIGYYFNEEWQMSFWDNAEEEEVGLPYTGQFGEKNVVVFRNALPMEYAGLTMGFSVENADVRVLVDDAVVYEQIQGAENAASEHFVNLPNTFEAGVVCIELTVLNQERKTVLGEIVVESRDMVVIGVVGNNLSDIFCCLLIVIMAIIMFVLALIRWRTGQTHRGELFLGLLGLAEGAYFFIGTDTLSIFYHIQEAYVMQEYLMLMVPVLLALYYDWNLRTEYPRRFAGLLCFVMFHGMTQLLLGTLKVCSMEDMAEVSVVVLIAVCGVSAISLLQFDKKHRRRQGALSLAALLVLALGAIARVILDACCFYMFGSQVGLHSVTVFCLIMTAVHVLQISKEYRANAEEKIKIAERQNLLLMQAKQEADVAKQEALAANEAKGKFLAHMSHEIRTPINAVLGMDEMILREAKEENIKSYAMDIYTAGQTLLSLINDILDFSKIESGKMEIVPVVYDISSLIHDLVNMTSQRIADKKLKLEVKVDHDIPCRLLGDDVRIRQILTNILTNGVKYTHEGTVWLRVQCRRTEDLAMLRFEVEDTGIGIKEEDLPKLFAEFERIEEERNRNIEGSGLGMNITIQLLALLGSKLQVESVYGKGSKFYFELEQKIMDDTPIGDFTSRVRKMAENYEYCTRFYAPEAKILVVDDNGVNRKVLRNLLKETQIQVTEADSGAACLRLVKETYFDLIFLDHMMPEMDGVETLHCIKSLPDCPCQDTPIVVLTANAVSGAKEKYLSEGFDDFLSKPIVPEKLEDMIWKLLPKELLQSAERETMDSLPQQSEKSGTSALLDELPFVEGLDWEYACLHLPDMELLQYTLKEFYAQIDASADCLEGFYEQLAAAVHIREQDNGAELMEHAQRNDDLTAYLEQYRIQVHAMKSLAAMVGMISLAGVARVLEYGAKDGKINVIQSMTAVFLEEWRSYRQKLRGVFGLGIRAGKEVTDNGVIRALVEMVCISMQEMDFDKADQLMEQLLSYEYPEEVGQNMEKFAEAVTNLDLVETQRIGILLAGQIEDGKITNG